MAVTDSQPFESATQLHVPTPDSLACDMQGRRVAGDEAPYLPLGPNPCNLLLLLLLPCWLWLLFRCLQRLGQSCGLSEWGVLGQAAGLSQCLQTQLQESPASTCVRVLQQRLCCALWRMRAMGCGTNRELGTVLE